LKQIEQIASLKCRNLKTLTVYFCLAYLEWFSVVRALLIHTCKNGAVIQLHLDSD